MSAFGDRARPAPIPAPGNKKSDQPARARLTPSTTVATDMTDKYAIEVKQLTKIYPPDHKAVDALDLNVREGEIMALLGPNGAGKSTTIRVLSTLSGFDSGQAIVAGIDVDRDPQAVRRLIGVVAQQTGVDYFLTGRENMRIQGHLYRMKRADIEARIDELARYFEIDKSLDKPVSAYSGGMTRKLDIATALIHRPRILFLDEPTLGLDIRSRKILWRHIEELNHEFGLTILLTTHYLEEADSLSDRVSIINDGRIQVTDTPEALKNAIKGDSVAIEFETAGEREKAFAARALEETFVQEVVWEGETLHLYLDNGASGIPAIMGIANDQGIEVKTLSLARPTLDDVFLKYTGTSIEGGQEEEQEQWWMKWAGKGGGGNWKKWAGEDGEESWEGNEWVDAEGGKKGEWSDDDGWQGNEWVNADGTPKAPPAETGTESETGPATGQNTPTDEAASTQETAADTQDSEWKGNEWVDAEGRQQGDWGNSTDWKGNEWVDAEGRPKTDWKTAEKDK